MSARPKLKIHIGTHKTGTSSLQFALRSNQHELLKQGYAYIDFPKPLTPLISVDTQNNELIALGKSILKKSTGRTKARNSDVTYLMSWEGFCGSPSIGYANAESVARHLREMTDDFDVSIIVYLRRQDSFLESMYTQNIHEGEFYSFQEFIDSLPDDSFNWHKLVSYYSDLFGNDKITVRRYDKKYLPNKDSLLLDFSQTIGVKEGSLQVEYSEQNRGYSRDAIEIAKVVHPYLDTAEKIEFRRILQSVSTKQPFERYSLWDHEKRLQLLDRYAESNAIIAREYCHDASNELFSPPEANQQEYQGLSLDAVTVVLAKFILFKNQDKSRLLRLAEKMEKNTSSFLRRRFRWLHSVLKKVTNKI